MHAFHASIQHTNHAVDGPLTPVTKQNIHTLIDIDLHSVHPSALALLLPCTPDARPTRRGDGDKRWGGGMCLRVRMCVHVCLEVCGE